MTNDKNPFGGANVHGLYVPMSEDEQEILARLTERDDLEVVVHEWGIVHKPRVTFGDKRVQVLFRLNFDRPELPIPVHYLDLELRTRAGMSIFKQRMSTEYGGKPIEVCAGVFLDLAWDIAITAMDPKLVKALKPGAFGLTSRRIDKDTRKLSFQGNMELDPEQRNMLRHMNEGEERMKRDDQKKVARAVAHSQGKDPK